MTGNELNELKWTVFSPFVEKVVHQSNFVQNKHDFISKSWQELFDLLKKYNFSDDTFNFLNNKYRDEIQFRILNFQIKK
ncbi:hypothetical protein MCEGE10_02527 [Flavobacteriaceae bacterium]